MRKHWIDNLSWVTVISVLIYHVFYLFNNKGVFGGIGGFVDDHPKGQPQDVVEYILYPWHIMILAMLGCFKAWFDRTDNFCGYMTRSSFGIYVVHYLVVVSFGTMFKENTQLSPWLIYTLLTIVTLLLSPALHEILRRIPFNRGSFFGIKIKEKI